MCISNENKTLYSSKKFHLIQNIFATDKKSKYPHIHSFLYGDKKGSNIEVAGEFQATIVVNNTPIRLDGLPYIL